MKLETSTKDFQTIMEVTDKLLSEIKLECDNDGIRFSGLDKSHICFIKVDFDKSYFESYLCEKPETLIVDTGDFLNVLKRMKLDDRLIIESKEDSLIVKFEGEATRTFRIYLIDAEYDTPMMPTLSYPNEDLEVSFKYWIDSLKDCKLYDQKVKLLLGEAQLYLICNGDKGSYESVYELDNVVNGCQSSFSIDFLERFNALGRVSNMVYLSLGDNMPLTLRVKDLLESLSVTLLLAPRIEAEDY